ncbi:hypothetical protein [Fictibacillus sp. WQ 8-8]|uniref:hypothetical protein n=1 Tax=Fictibacillus sp. WQ 8-8 TaxID=2938788 RepID=UPI00210923A4|nr:hypothetical protein [Fictibacillus sp. WQ 8-8]
MNRGDVYLRFNTRFTGDDEVEQVYSCWIHIPSVHNDGEVTDEQFIEACLKEQTPIFEQIGGTILGITLDRVSEFEYMQHVRKNKETEGYVKAKLRQSGWKV